MCHNSLHVIFICMQLDYKVTVEMLEDIFRIAGNVLCVELKMDKDKKFRGMATVRFEHPMESVQAICILCFCYFSMKCDMIMHWVLALSIIIYNYKLSVYFFAAKFYFKYEQIM